MAYEMSAVTGPFVTKPTCAIGVGPGASAEAAENTGCRASPAQVYAIYFPDASWLRPARVPSFCQ